jgi:hypothetical protein
MRATGCGGILSFRDFDWPLLGMVLVLCTISVFEIYSATLHTKYSGFHTKQLYWIGAGLLPCSSCRRSIITSCWTWLLVSYGFFLLALVAVKLVGHKALGGPALDQAGADQLSAFGVVQAGADCADGALFCQSWAASGLPGRIFSRRLRWWECRCCWC